MGFWSKLLSSNNCSVAVQDTTQARIWLRSSEKAKKQGGWNHLAVAFGARGAPRRNHVADGDRNGTDGRRVKSTARSFNPGDDQCPESAD